MQSRHSMLDNPVWHALTTRQRSLGQQGRFSCRYQPDIGPFAAVIEPTQEAFLELHTFIPEHGQALIQSVSTLPALAHLRAEALGVVLQMIAPDAPASVQDDGVQRLGPLDVEEMLQLVLKTKPGPFGKRTMEMGSYIGIRDQGRLIAMAGERMQLNGFVEISAVCVDDAYRGRNLAGRLMNILRRDILLRGDTPFLHVLDNNLSAISLYKRLGFETRQTFLLSRIERYS